MCYNSVTNEIERMIAMRKFLTYSVAAALGAALLAGCTAQADGVATLPLNEGTTPVFTARAEATLADGGALSAAIAPGAVVELGKGTIEMTGGALEDTAYCSWENLPDGFQLVIHDADNLTIRGASSKDTGLETACASAVVLSFRNCKNLTLEGFSVSHVQAAGESVGYGLHFQDCENVKLQDVGTYGRNHISLVTDNTKNLTAEGCLFQSADGEGVSSLGSTGIRLRNCTISGIGSLSEEAAGITGYTALYADGSGDITLEGCTVADNRFQNIAVAEGAQVTLENCTVEKNVLKGCGFLTGSEAPAEWGDTGAEGSIVLKNCTGSENQGSRWLPVVGSSMVTNDTGRELMEVEISQALGELQAEKAQSVAPQMETVVTTVEDFLAAIDSNMKIIVDMPLLDLSEADTTVSGDNYLWEEVFDGVQLVIHDVDDLTVAGKGGKGVNVISAVPRYAQVLNFRNCTNVSVEDLTAGHTKEPGYCIGGVLLFESCTNARVSKCGLYGCGTIGVQANDSRNVIIQNNDIYECSYGGISLDNVATASMDGNTFRDLGDEYGGFVYQVFSDCTEVTFEGKRVVPGTQEAYTK